MKLLSLIFIFTLASMCSVNLRAECVVVSDPMFCGTYNHVWLNGGPTTVQCTWGGLPITLYLGTSLNGDLYAPTTTLAFADGSQGSSPHYGTMDATEYTEDHCVLSATTVTWVSDCQGSVPDSNPCFYKQPPILAVL